MTAFLVAHYFKQHRVPFQCLVHGLFYAYREPAFPPPIETALP